MESDLIRELWLPQLPEEFNNNTLKQVNFELYLKIHYLIDTGFFGKDYCTEGRSRFLLNAEVLKTITQTHNIPQEWVLDFMCNVENIEWRRFLFEHFIDEKYDTFNFFDKIDYQEYHLDRIIWDLSILWVEWIIDAFKQININTKSIEEIKLVFDMIYHLLWRGEDVSFSLKEALDILNGFKDDSGKEVLKSGDVNNIKQSIVLLKIHWVELSLNNLITHKDLYKSVWNIFLTNNWESNALTNFIHTAWRLHAPEIISEADWLKSQAERSLKNIKIWTWKIKNYVPVESIKEGITKSVDWIWEGIRSINLPLEIQYNVEQFLLEPAENIAISFNEFKDRFTIGLWLISQELAEKHSDLWEWHMESFLKKHKDEKEIAHISDEEFYSLYRKYYSFLKMKKTIQNSFESNDSWVRNVYEQRVWKRALYYVERYSKKALLKFSYKLPLITKILSVSKYWIIKHKIIYALWFLLWIDKLKWEFTKLDLMKKFDTPEYNSPLLISPEYDKFLNDNLDRLNTISVWLEELEEAKRLKFELDKLQPILDMYEKEIDEIANKDNGDADYRSIRFTKILKMAEAEEKLEELTDSRKKLLKDYVHWGFSARENQVLTEISKLMEDENTRSNKSFNNYNNR